MKLTRLSTNKRITDTYTEAIILNKAIFLEKLAELLNSTDTAALRRGISILRNAISHPREDKLGLLNIDRNGDTITTKREAIFEQLWQIEEAYTAERAKYYIISFSFDIDDFVGDGIWWLQIHDSDHNLMYDKPFASSMGILSKKKARRIIKAEFLALKGELL